MGESLLSGQFELLHEIADTVGTPTYVYDAQEIRRRYSELALAFRGIPVRICYSLKANSSLAVLALLRRLGAGADIVSGGELVRARRAGFGPADMVFSGVGKSPSELELALDAGVGLINVESSGEVETLGEIARSRDAVARYGIRVNPAVTADTHPYTRTAGKGIKFGVPVDQVVPMALLAASKPELRLVSIGMHIGSQIVDPTHFREGSRVLEGLVQQLRQSGIESLESVDVGGGLGIRYTDEVELFPDAFADAVRPLAEVTGLPLLIEPGRFLVGAAGVLLTRCLYAKHSGGRELRVVDAGMNDFVRPSLYGAAHAIRVVGKGGGTSVPRPACRVDVVGPVCESGDFLGLDRDLPDVRPGTLLAILSTGAYGFSMSSTYNSRPRPAEAMVDDQRWALIRARETVDDLMRGETVNPEWQTGEAR